VNRTNGALSGLGPEELRAAVRAVLAEVLPAGTVVDGAAPSGDVVIATDADQTAFVRRVAALCEDADVRAALQAGTHGFRLSGASGGFETVAARPPQPQMYPDLLKFRASNHRLWVCGEGVTRGAGVTSVTSVCARAQKCHDRLVESFASLCGLWLSAGSDARADGPVRCPCGCRAESA